MKKKLEDQRDVSAFIEEFVKEEDEVNLREDKYNKFNDDHRICCMTLLGEANESITKISQVIQIVGEHIFKKKFEPHKLPSASTILNFADEAHYLGKHPIVEEIIDESNDHFMYALDETSRQKKAFLGASYCSSKQKGNEHWFH